MSLLIRKYKSVSGMMQEERIDDPDRIERYMRIFEKDDIKKNPTAGRECAPAGNREKRAVLWSVCEVLLL